MTRLRRLADSRLGDDNLTRFIKLPGRHDRKHRAPSLMAADATTTRYPSTIVAPEDTGDLLMAGKSNIKIGGEVRKGKFRDYVIATMSFAERASCPTTCKHWRDCYGNNMPFAKRLDHTSPHLLPKLEAEIVRKLKVRGRKGLMVRLHALGDFFSVDYVQFWERMLVEHPTLACWGYTARMPLTPIGDEIARVVLALGDRFAIRWSDGGLETHSTVSIATADECPPNAFVCPEQTEKTRACATCAACWGTIRNVAFIGH